MNLRTQAKEILFDALDIEPSERNAWLATRCADNHELRQLVDELLHAHVKAGAFLADPTASGTPQPTEAGSNLEPGMHVDDYRLISVIGEGGFGIVFHAEQERPLIRKVALKVIKLGMDSEQVVARFEAERQAVALMEHPGIAKVLDAGTTPQGRPYFVMEFIQGEHITEFCDRRQLTIQERLELFTKVCLAVQHAHQKGVIHRDLKPGNVMVTVVDGRPEPKVIDFGIAKAMGCRLSERTLTRQDQLVGTPEYMSPEQASTSGEDTDTRSDVFSLGALLYRLLTGVSPYDEEATRDASLAEWARLICEQEAPRPSTRVRHLDDGVHALASARHTTPDRLCRDLRQELDWIVLKAVEKDRSRRYPTANALAADLLRYLNDEPTEAGPPTTIYRLHKFCRRNRAAVFTGAFVLGASIVAAGISINSAMLAEDQRTEAQRQLAIAKQQSYAANIFAADAALGSHDCLTARRRLDATPVALRGWEWEFLDKRTDRSCLTIRVPDTETGPCVFHPDGDYLATSWSDGSVRMYELATGQERFTFSGLDSTPSQLNFTSTGNDLYVATRAGEVYRWSWHSGEKHRLPSHGDRITTMHLLANDSRLLTGSWDQTVRILDLETETDLHSIRFPARVEKIAVDEMRNRIAVSSWDQRLQLYDLETATLIAEPQPARASSESLTPRRWAPRAVSTMHFVSATEELIVGVRDGKLSSWNSSDGSMNWSYEGHRHIIRSARTSPNGKRLAVASYDRRLTLWDAEAHDLIITLQDHDDEVRDIEFSADSSILITGSWDNTIKLWRSHDGLHLATLHGHSEGIFTIALSPNQEHLVSRSVDGSIRLWELPGIRGDTLHGFSSFLFSIAAGPDDLLVTSEIKGSAKIWKLDESNTPKFELKHATGIFSVAAGQHGKLVATGGDDGKIRIWDATTGKLVHVLTGHQDRITELCFSDRFLASASRDKTARLWDPQRGLLVRQFDQHNSRLTDIGFIGDSTSLVTCCEAGQLRFFSCETGELERTIDTGSSGEMRSFAIAPNSKHLAFGSDNRTINLYKLPSGTLEAQFTGHAEEVTDLIWIDATRLASCSTDRTVRLWDPATGENVATLRGHSRQVRCLAISSDGRRLISGGEDQIVKVWER